MAAMAAFPGLFFCFAAMVLLIFVSVSVPTWHAVSFLKVGPAGAFRYGIFGYTGSGISVGYNFPDSRVNSTGLHRLTYALILHPIAAGLSFFSLLFGICGLNYHRSGTILMTLSSGLACLITFVAFIIDIYIFTVARNRYRDFTTATYGNAAWITLGALISLFLASLLAACGVFGKYRRQKRTTAY